MRRLPWIVLLLMVLLGAGWWFLLISSRNDEISRLEAELDAAFGAEDRVRIQIRDLEQVRDREPQYLAALATLETLIPEQPQLDEIIEYIHRLALDTGVRLDSISPVVPQPSATDPELRVIGLATRIDGEFFQVLGFLFGLNDLDRLFRVDSIAVNSSQDEAGRTRLTVALQIRAFTLADVLPEVLEPLPPIDFDDEEPPAEEG